MKKTRIFWAGMYLLIFFIIRSPTSYAQIDDTYSIRRQQVPRKIIVLMIKKDICTLIDHLEIPTTPRRGWRSFFSSPSRKQIQIRVQRDKLLRRYIDCIREYILIFSRLSFTEKSKMTYSSFPTDLEDHFESEIEIETFTSALADTIQPNLAHKKIFITFKVDFKYSETGWSITNIYDFSYHPN